MTWDINMLTAALGGANTALDMLGKLVGANGDAKVQAATAELRKELGSASLAFVQATQHLMELQKEIATLQRENDVLREQLAKTQTQAENDARYQLVELEGQQFAYLFEPTEGERTPRHYLCARCRTEKKNSVLQGHGRPGNFKCPICSTIYITDRNSPRSRSAITDDEPPGGPQGWMR
ncbi:TPA: hypothetical protein QDB46_003223 [Burkholderia multivorans]|nr:hypothetical protein [Burkholderia multivorans]EEE15164.1 conserved hypothetical protein [Burkholderia multivorans CGD2M]MBU9420614.1 hypothetical protein [Burkholderia multivorans]HDR9288092.1 hypothetical protein [Burkholderia multivorans]HDR9291911.1 hypothetical protein [Burkholderia multivorans]HDR9297805.1 hypothetical protein [Burkholderia multivorans]